ncbi:MAG: hemerythrin family protein [Rhodospirillaceae bacterium]
MTNDYSTISADHDRLSQLIDLVVESMSAKNSTKSNIENALTNLLNAAKEHFINEERVMEKAGYPGLSKHRYDHAHLKQCLSDYIRLFDHGMISPNSDGGSAFKSWLDFHIKKMDNEFLSWSSSPHH